MKIERVQTIPRHVLGLSNKICTLAKVIHPRYDKDLKEGDPDQCSTQLVSGRLPCTSSKILKCSILDLNPEFSIQSRVYFHPKMKEITHDLTFYSSQKIRISV